MDSVFKPPLRLTGISAGSLFLAMLLVALPLRAAETDSRQPANYAFAAYMGSGIYTSGDSSLFVINIPTTFDLPDYPDTRIRLAFSAGFFDYNARSILDLDTPDQFGTLTLIPGIEKTYHLSDHLDLIPHIDWGYASNLSSHEDAQVYAAGTRAEYRFKGWNPDNLWISQLLFAGTRAASSNQTDNYVKILTGVDYAISPDFRVLDRPVRATLYSMLYWSHNGIDFVERWREGRSSETVLEAGVTLYAPHPYTILYAEFDRIGFGYQDSAFGGLIRLFIGSPF